ncbi:uncharacterized protein BKCO1_5300011 [Diplodia corticola]|uniref:Uncharacterized protein n=1 Tax=Diplodia corticola TaxID=236234 RepID=A0A1J9QRB8_9PEZI|nr:uncharacterized protein BKCO1_5300011 [Diplodia corticola]OJD30961.1 hypothetical protein BKCO1_5300011 [Diplodia corticola]
MATLQGTRFESLGSLEIKQHREDKKDGDDAEPKNQLVYEITQLEDLNQLPKLSGKATKEIDMTIIPGILSIYGYVSTDTWEIGLGFKILGSKYPAIYGNAKEGLVIKLDSVYKGEIRVWFELKDGKPHVYIKINLEPKFPFNFLPSIHERSEIPL